MHEATFFLGLNFSCITHNSEYEFVRRATWAGAVDSRAVASGQAQPATTGLADGALGRFGGVTRSSVPLSLVDASEVILAASPAQPWDMPAGRVAPSCRPAGGFLEPIHAVRTVPLCSPVKMRCTEAKSCSLQRNSRMSNVK